MSEPAKLVIRNIGLIVSGKIEQPILDGVCIIALDGRSAEVGRARDLDLDNACKLPELVKAPPAAGRGGHQRERFTGRPYV